MWLVVEFYYSQLLAVSLVCYCGTPCSRNLEESAIMYQGDGFMVVVTEHVACGVCVIEWYRDRALSMIVGSITEGG